MLVVPLWLVLVLCTHWEPVLHDGWNHDGWHRTHSLSFTALYEFCKSCYLEQNPRLGQLTTLLMYSPGPYHAIVTPVLELLMFFALTTLVLGRWPSLRNTNDALVAATLTATVAICTPEFGQMLFYRAFTGNYTVGLTLNLVWLIPYRLELEQARPARRWLALPLLVLGLAAGLSNEHTGLAFAGMGLFATVIAARRAGLRIWMLTGLVGLIAGYALLLGAPGQHLRYGGLADHAGVLRRIADRGLVGNFHVVWLNVVALAPAVPLFVLGLVERRTLVRDERARASRWSHFILVLAGCACTLTLLASPKLGPRLYLASVALISAGLVGWVCCQLHSRWAHRACAAFAIGVLVVTINCLLRIYSAVGPLWATRLERMEQGPPGAAVVVPRYPFGASRWFYGDDFADPTLRYFLAQGFHLKSLDLEP
jgi:hypothetical protein